MSANGGAPTWVRKTVRVGDCDLSVLEGGHGKPLLVLHEELGYPGAMGWDIDLAARRTLVVPQHPGFGATPRLDWIGNVRDLASFYAAFVRSQKLDPVEVVGVSFGGWLAAEMIAADPGLFSKAVLIAPHGIRPPQGEIYDIFRVTAKKYLQVSVLDPIRTPEFASIYGGEQTPQQFEAWEDARAEIARLAWSPYMFDASLQNRLALVSPPPTLVVWGREDPIVPASAGAAYTQALGGSQSLLLDRCGHRPELERQDEFLRAVRSFLDS